MILAFLLGAGAGVVGAGAFMLAWRRARGGASRADAREPEAARAPESERQAEAPAREALRSALADAAARLGARRAILWDVDTVHDLAHACAVTSGEHPPDLGLRGDAIGWALTEQMPLRLTTSQRWSRGGNGGVVPLRREGPAALATFEFAVEAELPQPQELALWGAYLQAFVNAEAYQAHAVAERAHTDKLLEVLRQLPRSTNETQFAWLLAEGARWLAGVDGAAVARWDGRQGEVIAVACDGPAPPVGSRFGLRQSVLGLVPIRGEAVAREHRREETVRLPVISPAERWPAEPRAAAALPLLHEDELLAIVGVWRIAESSIDGRAREQLETLAGYAALHLPGILAFTHARHDSRHDPLTQLANRRAFEERLADESARHGRYGRPLALIMLDLDHFKRINDGRGHDAGDEVLRVVGQTLRAELRESDLPARLGGEEFVIILPETTLAAAAETAERLRARIERTPVAFHGESIAVSASFGVAAAPECVASPTALLESADAALYRAKEAGRNRVASAGRSAGAER